MKMAVDKKLEIEGNRYKMLAIAVVRETGMSLADALSLTLVEAWLSMGAEFYG